MNFPLELISLEKVTEACPAQWEGHTDDRHFVYIRYRFGRLSMRVDGKNVYSNVRGSAFDGSISQEEMLEELSQFVSYKPTLSDAKM